MPADRPALVWTREAPTVAEPGWWWRRVVGTTDIESVDIVYMAPWISGPTDGYEWSGPIPLPEEADRA